MYKRWVQAISFSAILVASPTDVVASVSPIPKTLSSAAKRTSARWRFAGRRSARGPKQHAGASTGSSSSLALG